MSAPGEQREGVRALLRQAYYRRLLVAQGISGLGGWVGTFAIIARAFDLTGSPTAVGGVLVVRLLAPLIGSPIGGVLADRVDRRLVLVTANTVNAGLIVLIPFVGLAPLYVIAFSTEFMLMLSLPARDAMVPGLVPAASLPQANGLVMGSTYAMLPVGAALFSGVRLVSERLPGWVPVAGFFRANPLVIPFALTGATFLAAAAMFTRIPPGQGRRDGPLNVFSGLVEAWRYARRSTAIRGLATGVGVAMFGGGVLFAVGIAYIHETLGGGDVEFGFLASLWGLGMALGLGMVRFLVHEAGSERIAFRSAVSACGAILVGMAFLPFTWLALVAALFFGMAFSMSLMLAITIIQRTTEESMLGRLMGGVQMLFRVSLAAGAIGVGGAAGAVDHLRLGPLSIDGNQFGLLLGGGLILLGAVVFRGRAATD